jgi:capsular polysaccharide biosynthesis protein
MKPNEYQEVISITELFNLLKRNLLIIFTGVIVGFILSIGVSTYRYQTQITITRYSLSTLISVDSLSLSQESLAMVNYTLSHPEVLTASIRKLNSPSADYLVASRNSDEEGIIIFEISGTHKESLAQISREIFNRVKPIVELTLFEVELRRLEINNPVITSQITFNRANWILNAILGVVIGGVFSVFYVLGMYFMSPYIVSDFELESVFNSKILGKFASKSRKSILRKFYEVR